MFNFGAYVVICCKQEKITLGDFLVLKIVLTCILYIFQL